MFSLPCTSSSWRKDDGFPRRQHFALPGGTGALHSLRGDVTAPETSLHIRGRAAARPFPRFNLLPFDLCVPSFHFEICMECNKKHVWGVLGSRDMVIQTLVAPRSPVRSLAHSLALLLARPLARSLALACSLARLDGVRDGGAAGELTLPQLSRPEGISYKNNGQLISMQNIEHWCECARTKFRQPGAVRQRRLQGK